MAESRETAAERGADTGEGVYRVVGSRVLPVPPEQAWQAWSDPEVVCQWWGPTGFSCPRADVDFRVGGTSLVTMQAPAEYGGMQLHNGWRYTGIEEPSRIEFYLTFTDEQGRVLDPAAVGIPAGVPREVPHVVELTPLEGGHTQLTVTERGYTSREARDVSQAGLEQTLDKLQALFGDSP
jgi:uncharacterized protein YndB with AHSA1/START domain